MISTIKVSVIVPVYNVEKYLARCMGSLIGQTLKDIEIILVDDGALDNCPALCDEFEKQDDRVKVIHKINGGLGFARNSGLEIATGEYVAFVDSDDYVDINMYETLYNAAKQHSLDTVYCGFNHVDKDLNVHPFTEVQELTVFEGRDKVDNVLLSMVGNPPGSAVDRRFQMSVWRGIYSKELIDRYGVKFPSERQLISEDIVFHTDYLQKAQKVAFLPNAFYFYCANEVSLTASYRKDRYEKYKTLSEDLSRRFSLLGIANYQQSIDRMFIGFVRSLIFRFNDYNMTKAEKKAVVGEISADEYWHKVMRRYPLNKLPFKYRVVAYLITHNYFGLLMTMTRIK